MSKEGACGGDMKAAPQATPGVHPYKAQ
jgi:hypothetical protein